MAPALQDTLCPSAPAEEGGVFLGTMGPDGRLRRVRSTLTLDAGAAAAFASAPHVASLRFAAPCAEGECGHWAQGQCGLIGQLRHNAAGLTDGAEGVPPCPIRASCRWWMQDGAAACAACEHVYRTRPAA